MMMSTYQRFVLDFYLQVEGVAIKVLMSSVKLDLIESFSLAEILRTDYYKTLSLIFVLQSRWSVIRGFCSSIGINADYFFYREEN